jgi:hypothetical protein
VQNRVRSMLEVTEAEAIVKTVGANRVGIVEISSGNRGVRMSD